MTLQKRATSLTAKELRLLELVAMGFTSNEIGAQLFVVGSTVKSWLGGIRDKLGTRDRMVLVQVFVQHAAPNEAKQRLTAWAEEMRQLLRAAGGLTPREREVIGLYIDPRYFDKEIAQLAAISSLSKSSFRSHLRRVTRSLPGGPLSKKHQRREQLFTIFTLAPLDTD